VTEIICIVGRGRMGTALAAAWSAAGEHVVGPLGREEPLPGDPALVVLAVPDAAIADAARRVPAGPLVAHCAASVPLSALGDREAFSMHPLLAVTGSGTDFTGAGCAIAGTSPRAAAAGMRLARVLAMHVVEVREEDRALYHAAASLASNYLVTLEGEAERLMMHVGIDRAMLLPLVRAAVEGWGARGAAAALTGPIVRGDAETVRRQRDAVGVHAPDLLPMWDALAERTRVLAGVARAGAVGGTGPR
jgi:predicted short-subunit dehydrogenase-like oxidoreductase (DUF2520 family)